VSKKEKIVAEREKKRGHCLRGELWTKKVALQRKDNSNIREGSSLSEEKGEEGERLGLEGRIKEWGRR